MATTPPVVAAPTYPAAASARGSCEQKRQSSSVSDDLNAGKISRPSLQSKADANAIKAATWANTVANASSKAAEPLPKRHVTTSAWAKAQLGPCRLSPSPKPHRSPKQVGQTVHKSISPAQNTPTSLDMPSPRPTSHAVTQWARAMAKPRDLVTPLLHAANP